jgi:broad specificity phosphatase PhoE
LTGETFKFGLTPFYFVRHGETGDSVRGILQGQVETVLSDEGRLTAWKAARVVLHDRPRSIYSSPLRRAWETAEIISRTIAVPIVALPGLKERDWGDFQGKPGNIRPNIDDPTGVESTALFRARVIDAMHSINGPLPVLVVAHSGVFRLLCSYAGIPFGRRNAVANGLVFRFEPPQSGGGPWHIEEIAE